MDWETWYVLESGGVADPCEVTPDEKGVLRHKGGVAVALRAGGVPHSRGVNPEEERAKIEQTAKKAPEKTQEVRQASTQQRRDMVAEGSERPYRTR